MLELLNACIAFFIVIAVGMFLLTVTDEIIERTEEKRKKKRKD